MAEYRSNSDKSREKQINKPVPEKKIEKVVQGEVRSKKKSGLQKITDAFVPDDVANVKSYIIEDIVVPAAKEILLDSVKAILGINSKNGNKQPPASRESYRQYYNNDSRRNYSGGGNRSRNSYDFDDIIIDNRGEAEEVLDRMEEIIATYDLVSVADFYELVGVPSNYTDNKYGWSNLRNAYVERLRDGGYIIKLPKAFQLD